MTGVMASALWYESPGIMALRTLTLPDAEPGFARIRILFPGIFRGTERLVPGGHVPQDEYTRMRALAGGRFSVPGQIRLLRRRPLNRVPQIEHIAAVGHSHPDRYLYRKQYQGQQVQRPCRNAVALGLRPSTRGHGRTSGRNQTARPHPETRAPARRAASPAPPTGSAPVPVPAGRNPG